METLSEVVEYITKKYKFFSNYENRGKWGTFNDTYQWTYEWTDVDDTDDSQNWKILEMILKSYENRMSWDIDCEWDGGSYTYTLTTQDAESYREDWGDGGVEPVMYRDRDYSD